MGKALRPDGVNEFDAVNELVAEFEGLRFQIFQIRIFPPLRFRQLFSGNSVSLAFFMAFVSCEVFLVADKARSRENRTSPNGGLHIEQLDAELRFDSPLACGVGPFRTVEALRFEAGWVLFWPQIPVANQAH